MFVAPLLLSLCLSSPVFQSETRWKGPNVVGDVRRLTGFSSAILKNTRDVMIYLPPGYDQNLKARYPVLYMQDGQNVFDPALSAFHNEWRADETAEALIQAKLIPPMIVVGIFNTGDRADEYLPTRAKFGNSVGGGNAEGYLKFLTQELKPVIDARYRTLKDRNHTAIGGTSFGGVLALYAGLAHPDVFSKFIVASPSIWWDDRVMIKQVNGLRAKLPLKIWVDIGTREGRDDTALSKKALQDAADVVAALESKGWKKGKDLAFFVDDGAEHNETSWARRFGMMLLYLYGHA